MSFLRRKQGGSTEDDSIPLSDSGMKKREWCSIGAIFNYSLAVLFIAMVFCVLIIIGTMGVLQANLDNIKSSYKPNENATAPKRLCYLYPSVDCPGSAIKENCTVQLNKNGTCDGLMVGFSFIAIMAMGFLISLVTKAILNHNLNITLYIELPVLVVFLMLSFSLSVALSVGTLYTCNAIKKYTGKGNCDQPFPGSKDFYTTNNANVAQNTSWFLFLFLVIALVCYCVRLGIYIRRRKKSQIINTVEHEGFAPGNDPADQYEEEPKAI